MRIRTAATAAGAELLCMFVQEGSKAPPVPGLGAAAPLVEQARRDCGGRLGDTAVVHVPGGRPARRILLVGTGKKSEAGPDTLRFAAGAAAKRAADIGVSGLAVMAPPGDAAEAASQIVEGVMLALYRFDRFKSEKEPVPGTLTILTKSAGAARAAREAEAVAEAAIFARDAANMPPNECTPAALAGIAKKIAGPRMRCSVTSGAELLRRGFGGIAAVGGGSRNGPRLIVLEYSGGPKKQRPVLLVGKAVTFDTGGISIKPRERMDEMKFDKCGGCAVLGIMRAVSRLRLPINVVGIIPSVENMPGGGAYRPGDIIRLYGGRTAEILNTDAEGRLILADALAYGESKYSPRAIIDFATLTGACIIALGCDVAGMVSNDDRLAGRVSQAAARTAEPVWRLPINPDYMEMVRSDVADVKNLGTGTAAGTIAAAAFLRGAVGSTPWVHLDIAGTAWMQPASKKRPYNPKGATGFGVRLAIDYLRNS